MYSFNYVNHSQSIWLPVTPMGKPRIRRGEQDARAQKWRRFKRDVQILWNAATTKPFPESEYRIFFILPMPDSWSREKREQRALTKHQSKPDKDNLEKAVLDALCANDQHIWDGRVTKLWAHSHDHIGGIMIYWG